MHESLERCCGGRAVLRGRADGVKPSEHWVFSRLWERENASTSPADCLGARRVGARL